MVVHSQGAANDNTNDVMRKVRRVILARGYTLVSDGDRDHFYPHTVREPNLFINKTGFFKTVRVFLDPDILTLPNQGRIDREVDPETFLRYAEQIFAGDYSLGCSLTTPRPSFWRKLTARFAIKF